MNDIMKIVKSPEEPDLLIKDVSETIQIEAKEQKGRFLSMLLSKLDASYDEICWQVRELFQLVKE